MTVRSVIDASVPMRAASRLIGLTNELNGDEPYDHPSHTTVQNFILRIGLYLLLRATRPHHDWIWVADHTYSVGTTKVFVVLGITLTDFQQLRRPLVHHDLEVLTLLPVDQSNGTIVHQQLTDLVGRVGVPLAVLSDRGSDLNKGVRLLQQDQPTVISLYDIVHLTSRKIEKVLNNAPQWDEFRKACCQCANAVRQSTLAHLKPPRPKTKARYMNIDREVRWGARALRLLDRVREGNLKVRQQVRLPKGLIEEKFGWLDEYRSSLQQWEHLSLTARHVISEVRRHGYGSNTVLALETIVESTPDESSRQLVRQIIDDVQPMCDLSGRHGSLPASSEVLESLFGKGKRLLSGTSSGTTNSLTRQMLAMVTSTARITPTLVQNALASCSVKNLLQWCSANFKPSLHVTRRQDLPPTETEQILRKPTAHAIPDF